MCSPPAVTEGHGHALVAHATQAREHAYAPYSGLRVGSALLAADGRLFVGANVENCAFGSTICAERHAVGAAVVAGARHFLAVAVVVDFDRAISPCGACRQVLAEFAVPWVLLHNLRDGQRACLRLAELLPHGPALASLARRQPHPDAGREP